MRLIPDAHALLWAVGDRRRLGSTALSLLADRDNEVLLSAAAVWEIVTKASLGKLPAPDGYLDDWVAGGALDLALTVEHARAAADLPWHHRDPFDRMLVAQAKVEGATIVSRDPFLAKYGVDVAW